MFKSQLQEFAQKAGLKNPVYGVTKEGPSHEPQYKATVIVNDETFQSPTSYGNLKKAEHAAAEVALMALSGSCETEPAVRAPLHESGLCKNLLQEYAQKSKLFLPIYSVVKSGATHSPIYNATVEICGVKYTGGACKSKKEAEIKAAKTALLAICSDLGASPSQAFENKLSSVGQPEAGSPKAPKQKAEKSVVKRKRRRRPWIPKGEFRPRGGRKKARCMEGKVENGTGSKDDASEDKNGPKSPPLDSSAIPGITASA